MFLFIKNREVFRIKYDSESLLSHIYARYNNGVIRNNPDKIPLEKNFPNDFVIIDYDQAWFNVRGYICCNHDDYNIKDYALLYTRIFTQSYYRHWGYTCDSQWNDVIVNSRHCINEHINNIYNYISRSPLKFKEYVLMIKDSDTEG